MPKTYYAVAFVTGFVRVSVEANTAKEASKAIQSQIASGHFNQVKDGELEAVRFDSFEVEPQSPEDTEGKEGQ